MSAIIRSVRSVGRSLPRTNICLQSTRSVARASTLLANNTVIATKTNNTTLVANSFKIQAFVNNQVRSYSASAHPSAQEIETRIIALLNDFDKVPKEKLNIDAHFIKDLGLDSLDQVEITMAIEDEFGIEFPDKDAEEIFTVRQAVEKVNSHQHAI